MSNILHLNVFFFRLLLLLFTVLYGKIKAKYAAAGQIVPVGLGAASIETLEKYLTRGTTIAKQTGTKERREDAMRNALKSKN